MISKSYMPSNGRYQGKTVTKEPHLENTSSLSYRNSCVAEPVDDTHWSESNSRMSKNANVSLPVFSFSIMRPSILRRICRNFQNEFPSYLKSVIKRGKFEVPSRYRQPFTPEMIRYVASKKERPHLINEDVLFAKRAPYVEMSKKSVTQALFEEGLLSEGVMKAKNESRRARRRRRRREHNSRATLSRRQRTKDRVRNLFEEPSPYYIDLNWSKHEFRTQANHFADLISGRIDPQAKAFEPEASSALKDMFKYLKNSLPDFSSLGFDRHTAFSIFVFVYQLGRSRNAFDVAAAVLQFSEKYREWIVDTGSDLIDVLVTRITDALHPYMSQGFHNVADIFDMVVHSDLARLIRDLILSILSFRWFDKETTREFTRLLGPISRMPLLELFDHVIKCICRLFRVAEAWAAGAPMSDVLFFDNPVDELLNRVADHLLYSTALYSGLPVEGCMDRIEFVQLGNKYVEEGDAFLKCLSRTDVRYRRLHPIILQLKRTLVQVGNEINQASRIPPIAIVLHGPPHVGKSILLNFLATVWSMIKGRKFKDGHVYHRARTSPYWEGYDPVSNPIIHYSEVGNESADQAAREGARLLQEIQMLVDGQPFPCDMAFDLKGKIYALPELILLDTNNKDMHATSLMYSHGAVKRRFLYIGVRVKAEFVKNGTTALDSAKSLAAGGNQLDRYEFHIQTYSSNRNKAIIDTDLTVDIYGLADFLVEHCTAHIERNDRIIEADITRAMRDYVSERHGLTVPEDDEVKKDEDIAEERPPDADPGGNAHLEASVVWRNTVVPQPNERIPLKERVSNFGKLAFEAVRDFAILGAISFMCLLSFMTGRGFTVPFIPMICVYFGTLLGGVLWYFLFLLTSIVWMINFIPVNYHWAFKLWKYFALKRMKSRFSSRKVCVSMFGLVDHTFKKSLFDRDHKAMVAAVAAIGLLTMTAISIFRRRLEQAKQRNTSFEGSRTEFFNESDHNEQISQLEEVFSCDVNRKRFKTKAHAGWNAMYSPVPESVYKGDPVSLSSVVGSNIRRVRVTTDAATINVHVLGVRGTYALLNAHALAGCKRARLEFSHARDFHNPISVFIEEGDIEQVCTDVLLVDMKKLRFRDITKHIISGDPVQKAEAHMSGASFFATFKKGTFTIGDNYLGSIKLPGVYHYKIRHYDGLCGMPLVCQITRTSSAIVGLHVAGHNTTNEAFALTVSREDVEDACKRLAEQSVCLPITSQSFCFPPTGEPSPKSTFRHIPLPQLQYFGKLEGPVLINKRSSLQLNPYAKDVKRVLVEHLHYEPEMRYVRPLMRPRGTGDEYTSPYNVCLEKMQVNTPSLTGHIMKRCVTEFSARIVGQLTSLGVGKLSPLSLQDSINGVEGDPFISRVNASTSGAFGYPGTKSKYLPIVHEDQERVIREPTSDLKRDIITCIASLEEGSGFNVIYSSQLKDEPRPIEKVMKGSTRVFYMSPLVFLVVSRMFLSPFYSLMVEFGEIFCTAVGINMHSQAKVLVDRLLSLSPHLMELDYSGFDVSMPLEVGKMANTVVDTVLSSLGYNTRARNVVRALLSENLFPVVEMNKDIFMKPGLQPSGKYATAEDNSLRGVLMLMYSFYTVKQHQEKSFFVHVCPIVYGDDLVASVSEEVKETFNNLAYASLCFEHYGMKVTPATKTGKFEKFLSIHEISFLRRLFVLDDQGHWRAPIALDSIFKALQWTLPSSNMPPPQQAHATFVSSMWEIFFHVDMAKYYVVGGELATILASHFKGEIADFPFPPYWEIYSTVFGEAYPLDTHSLPHRGTQEVDDALDIDKARCLPGLPDISALNENSGPQTSVSFSRDSDLNQWLAENKVQEVDDLLENVRDRLSHVESLLAPHSISDYRKELHALNHDYTGRFSNDYRVQVLPLLEEWASCVATLHAHSTLTYSTQSDNSGSLNSIENVIDHPGEDVEQKHSGDSSFINLGQTEVLEMQNFLSRPVEIDNFTVVVGSFIERRYDIWSLFLLDPAVRAKLRNFPYISGDLMVEVNISGTPFHYGKVMMSYQPLAPRNAAYVAASETYLSVPSSTSRAVFVNYLSQSKGRIVIDVRDNQPARMRCPFISPKPLLKLFNKSSLVLPGLQSFEESAGFGTLVLQSINPVLAASTSPTAVGIQVFAWMENVQLGTTTATQLEVLTQSGECDEREVGPIEDVASSIALVAKKASNVPIVGDFARASIPMANAVTSVAAHMGWSRPSLGTFPSYIKDRPFANTSHGIGFRTNERVVIDPKQELTVDPRSCGVETDDMALSAIWSVESYVTTFAWESTDTPESTVLFATKVTPCMDSIEIGLATYVQPTAMSFAVRPFRWWRGDIIYRFEIVASQFHRGKLMICYEPNPYQSTLITADASLNKNFIKIVDIQESQNVELAVRWANDRVWLRVLGTDTRSVWHTFSTATEVDGFVNGMLWVTPFTNLQAPTAPVVEINLYSRAENLQVNQVSEVGLPDSRTYRTQAGKIASEDCVHEDLNVSTASSENTSLVCFGEEPVSFRMLLKRSVTTQRFFFTPGGPYDSLQATGPIYPPPKPAYGDLLVGDRNLFQYLRYAYLGMKGGIILGARFLTSSDSQSINRAHISIGTITGTTPTLSVNTSGAPALLYQRGTSAFVPNTNGGVEAELPYYSDNLFVLSFSDDLVGPNTNGLFSDSWSKDYDYYQEFNIASNSDANYVQDTAIAEDFSFMRFSGAPLYSFA